MKISVGVMEVWANNSTEKQFGKPDDNGDFSQNGSPRWKQGAYYDFLKDYLFAISGVPIIRFSI